MTHFSEEDLILIYYEERRRSARVLAHLDACAPCAEAYRALAATLDLVRAPETPERGDQYGLEVWQRVRTQLPEPEPAWWAIWLRADRLAVAGAFAVIVVAAFVAGRWWSASTTPAPAVAGDIASASRGAAAPIDREDARQRVLLTSVADHLDRSERVLTDIVNAPAGEDLSAQQRWAADLVAASRLYRQGATDAGEQSVAAVLDDLERSLIEIVHTPSHANAAKLDELRRRIDAASLLFKVRVLEDELRQREQPDASRPRTRRAQTS